MNIHELAEDLKARLAPGCDRIEIAGSIRRGKVNPKDIEIVAVPTVFTEMATVDLWGNPGTPITRNQLAHALELLFAGGSGAWSLDPELPRNGPKYKRLRYWGGKGVCCDLFITTPENWGVIFAIRTGPADFSHGLVTRALRLGLKVDGGQLWRVHRDDTRTVVPTPEEDDFFKALGLAYQEPQERQ